MAGTITIPPPTPSSPLTIPAITPTRAIKPRPAPSLTNAVCRVKPGDKLQAGERYGLIRFGSRTDLVVPKGTEMRVKAGDRVRGGETIMAMLR